MKEVPAEKLAKACYKDNFEYAQWFKGFYDFIMELRATNSGAVNQIKQAPVKKEFQQKPGKIEFLPLKSENRTKSFEYLKIKQEILDLPIKKEIPDLPIKQEISNLPIKQEISDLEIKTEILNFNLKQEILKQASIKEEKNI